MAETYKTLYGFDWPKELTDDNVRLLIGKKWREFRDEYGFPGSPSSTRRSTFSATST